MIQLSVQKGLALVLALWLLVLLTLMASGYTTTMRTETTLIAQDYHGSMARGYAEAGLWLAMNELLKPEDERTMRGDGAEYTIPFHDGEIRISIEDEAGKIDLNTANIQLLKGLLLSTDIDENEILEIQQAIQDWRDSDNTRRDSGAEDYDYASAGYDYGAKDGAFNSLEELRLVMGMTEAIYQDMRSSLTIFSQQSGINPLRASRKTLLALPDVTEEEVDEFISNRGLEEEGQITNIAGRYGTDIQDRSLSIHSTGIKYGTEISLHVMINMTQDGATPYRIVSWKED